MYPRFPAAPLNLASLLVAVLLAAPIFLLGCGKEPTAPPPPPDQPSVSVSPNAATVIVHGTRTFTATVDNLSDATVTWRVSRLSPTPDTASLGSITAVTQNSALYTAPDRVAALLDYKIAVTAVSVADTNVRGSATVTIPRVIVSVIPSSLSSVPPGSLVPMTVNVQNAPDPGFTLYVEGTVGGDPDIGTWAKTGPTATVYQAPRNFGVTSTVSLLAKSTEDSARFGTSNITVRAGFPMSVRKTTFSQYAPSWQPGGFRLAYVQGGPPWEVAFYDFNAGGETTLFPIEWSQPAYDGRISWSGDGTKLAVSEQSGGRRVIAIVQADGSTRTTFAPDGATDYFEAAFIPKLDVGAPESLLVTQQSSSGSSLRIYPLSAASSDPGKLLYAAPAGSALRFPDAIRSNDALLVAAERTDGSSSDLLSLADDGSGGAPLFIAGGPGRRTQVRFARQPGAGIWIDFISEVTRTSYRVHRDGQPPVLRLYSEFFPQLGGDVSGLIVWDQGAHALSRLQPDGMARIWLVEFPPPDFLGLPQREELELASIGARAALSPSSWSRWLGNTSPALGFPRGDLPSP